MADGQDAIELKRRARRRLVGAIALVVFVVIVLPIVLDREPKPISQDLTIQIPSQDAGKFSSPVLPGPLQSPAKPAAPASTSRMNTASDALPPVVQKPPAGPAAPSPETSAAATNAKTSQQKRAQPAAPAKSAPPMEPKPAANMPASSFVVPLGVFSRAENAKQVRSKASAAGFKTFTEPVTGTSRIRVRAGPFANREAAEKARQKLKGAGLDVGAVAAR